MIMSHIWIWCFPPQRDMDQTQPPVSHTAESQYMTLKTLSSSWLQLRGSYLIAALAEVNFMKTELLKNTSYNSGDL